MKIKFDKEKLKIIYAEILHSLPIIVILTIVVVYAILSFMALYPAEDKVVVSQGDDRLKELDIKFNTRLLNDLKNTKTPTQVGGNGGRDPFAGF